MDHKIEGYEGRRLDVLYKQPTQEAAHQKMILKVFGLLQQRQQNESSFSLDTAHVVW